MWYGNPSVGIGPDLWGADRRLGELEWDGRVNISFSAFCIPARVATVTVVGHFVCHLGVLDRFLLR